VHAAVPLLFTSIAISTSTCAGAGAGARWSRNRRRERRARPGVLFTGSCIFTAVHL